VTPPNKTILVIENEAGGRPAQLRDAADDAGLDLDVRSVAGGDPIPTDIEDVAGLAVLGATYDVRDAPERPHLYRVMGLIRQAAERDRPALGICLGGQLAAEALGGRVERAGGGPEIGWVPVRATDEGRSDPVASVLAEPTRLFLWHHDVFIPPRGAIRVLTADRHPDQGFRMGSVWGIQSHPEVDAGLLREWCESPDGSSDLKAAGLEEEDLLHDASELARRARAVLDAWCRVVADRPAHAHR